MPRPPFMRGGGQTYRKKYTFIPPPSSGAHIILVAMFKAERDEFIKNLTKLQVLDYCKKHSQSGFKDSGKIWASMKGLIDKSLVGRQIARDPLYYLMEEGKDLAQKLITMSTGEEIDLEIISPDEASRETQFVSSSQHSVTSSQNFVWNDSDSTFELKAGSFDIVLIIDQREKIEIYNNNNTIKTEHRTLACGDFIWIARPKNIASNDRTKDLVLDYVIERKRMDDLSQSIFDGRFEQQKHRLVSSGIRRPVYLIEEYGQMRTGSMNSSSLAQAIVNILIHDGIDVEKVKNASHANDYLISMTKCLEKVYSNTDLISCSQERLKSKEAQENEFMTFSEFQTKGAKITNWTVKEMFAKHLIQITGVSERSVAAIINKYPTLSALVEAYRNCNSEKEKENLLAKLKIPDAARTIGPAISKRVYTCYAMPVGMSEGYARDDNNDDEYSL